MSESKKYTIVVKRQRVEVSEAVYHLYNWFLSNAQSLVLLAIVVIGFT